MQKTEFKVGEVFQLGLIHIKVEEAVQVRCEECFVSTMKGIPTHLMRNTWGETFRLSWNAMQSFSAVDGKTAKDVRLNTK